MDEVASGTAKWSGGKSKQYAIDDFVPMRGSLQLESTESAKSFLLALLKTYPFTFPLPAPYITGLMTMATMLVENKRKAGNNGDRALKETLDEWYSDKKDRNFVNLTKLAAEKVGIKSFANFKITAENSLHGNLRALISVEEIQETLVYI